MGMSTAVRERKGCRSSIGKSARVNSFLRVQSIQNPATALQNPSEIHENRIANSTKIAISDALSHGYGKVLLRDQVAIAVCIMIKAINTIRRDAAVARQPTTVPSVDAEPVIFRSSLLVVPRSLRHRVTSGLRSSRFGNIDKRLIPGIARAWIFRRSPFKSVRVTPRSRPSLAHL